MTEAWRIVRKRHAASVFDGEGARRYGGRWNSRGTPIVYASESRALALLEVLAGIRSSRPLGAYLLLGIRFDDSLITSVDPDDLPARWRHGPPPTSTRRIGDVWAASRESAVLRVPSVIVPEESNYLLNPFHPHFFRMEIGPSRDLAIDARLMGIE